MLNRIVLIGRLTRDPELKYTQSGIAVCSFSIAVDRKFKNPETGEKEVDFIDIVAWRQSAEFAANNLTKGRLIAVDGRLQIRKWTAQDGTARRNAEVQVDDLRALDRPKQAEESTDNEQPDPAPASGDDKEYDDPFAEE